MSTSAPVLIGADYPADYVELTFTTDEQTLADNAVANLQTTWTDWMPNDADVDLVLIETLAPYATAAVQHASWMPRTVHRALTKLYGSCLRLARPRRRRSRSRPKTTPSSIS